jgi:hypothetical protein
MKRWLQFTLCLVAPAAILLGADSTTLGLRLNLYDAVVQPAARAQTAQPRRRPAIEQIRYGAPKLRAHPCLT